MTIVRQFPVQLRQSTVEAPLVSQSYTAPSGLVSMKFQATIPTADYENAANSFELTVEEQVDGVWVSEGRPKFIWRGGPFIGKGGTNPPPAKTVLGPDIAGKTVRMSIVVPNPMQLGGIISTEP